MCLHLLTSADSWLAVKANRLGGSGVVRALHSPAYWLVENTHKCHQDVNKSSMCLNIHLHLSRGFKDDVPARICLYQHPLLHQGITQRFAPSSWREFVLQVGRIYFNACPGFSFPISVYVEQMVKDWWGGWWCRHASPSGDVLDLNPAVAACGWGSLLLCEINAADNICVGMLHPCGAQQLHLYKSR